MELAVRDELVSEATIVGSLEATLDQCGPKGNRGVEQRLDYHKGRLDMLSDLGRRVKALSSV